MEGNTKDGVPDRRQLMRQFHKVKNFNSHTGTGQTAWERLSFIARSFKGERARGGERKGERESEGEIERKRQM